MYYRLELELRTLHIANAIIQ